MTLLSSPAHTFRMPAVDEVGLLIDGADYYTEFYRAALRAEHYILLSGWQFDSEVALLRGPEAEAESAPVTLLAFLQHLCEQKPDLRIWILAWDFHIVFAGERELLQSIVFRWNTSERLQFRFDDNHVERGCHHQKFVVIDGELSFLGGLDLCEDRWDDRKHSMKNPLRVSHGEAQKPFHDIQAYVRGRDFSGSLTDLFMGRWQRAAGEPLALPLVENEKLRTHTVERLLRIDAREAALSRTDPFGSPGGPLKCMEIASLHTAAILSAQRFIYAETQYLSSHTIAEAFEQRMRAQGQPALEIVLVLNMRGETLKEQAAVGLAQAKIIGHLRKVAAETGHQLGIYYTLPDCSDDEQPERATYIHSKLMVVDDRLLTVGSANLTNRSMVIDTELNLSVETEHEDALASSIRQVRATLLAEHTGGPELHQVEGLVRHLDELAERGARGDRSAGCRLRRHPSPTVGERAALALVDPQKLPFDPDQIEEFDSASGHTDFLSGLSQGVRDLFAGRGDNG